MEFLPQFPEAVVNSSPLMGHLPPLRDAFERGWQQAAKHGDIKHWQQALQRLPCLDHIKVMLDQDAITIEGACSEADRLQLLEALRCLMPWRKGPFCIAGIEIDCEWRSDLKWDRLADAIAPLAGRMVLDIGCGSGYYCWRMRGAGASLVVGIDPTTLFAMQFQAIQHYVADPQVQMWPIGIDALPVDMGCFDTVFSMGLLYHRRSPLDHLKQLQSLLRPDGELVLETLVVAGDEQTCLVPQGRYAKMRNVWFIPSIPMLTTWLTRCGWRHIRVLDCTATTSNEQRATAWMPFESLADFLDPEDDRRTIEGYPAPQRAMLIAQR